MITREISVAHVVAYFAPAFGYGGPARSVLAMCQAQAAAGMRVEVFTTTANLERELAPAPAATEYDGVRVRYFRRTLPKRLFHGSGLRSTLQRQMKHVDVVHVHGLFNATSWTGAYVAQQARKPYVLSAQGMLTPAARRHHARRKQVAWALFDRRSLERAALLHGATPAEAEEFNRLKGAHHVTIVPHAVAVKPATREARAAIRVRLGFAGAPYVLFLGRIHPIKRLDLLASAFTAVSRELPTARLVIAGSDADGHRRAIEPLLAEVSDRVKWLPPVDGDEKVALLAEASVLVQCSNSESFGMAIAEALGAGVPVVATTTCPWPELETEMCGAWIEQRAESIATAVMTLLQNPTRARCAGARGAALIESRYSSQAIGEQWRRAYERLL